MSENISSEIIDTTQLDSVVKAVLNKFTDRARFGKNKYGTDLDRTDLNTVQWIEHTQEELMDGILYLEKLKQHLKVLQPNEQYFSK
jgi:hypothetical protein